MNKLAALAPMLLLGLLPAANAASDHLDFAALGGIRDFRPDGDAGIYIEGRNNQWYHADFFAPCYALRFHETVGFVIDPTDTLDRFSSILVAGDQCYFKSFEKTDKPGAGVQARGNPVSGQE